jgi:hypothetical protein
VAHGRKRQETWQIPVFWGNQEANPWIWTQTENLQITHTLNQEHILNFIACWRKPEHTVEKANCNHTFQLDGLALHSSDESVYSSHGNLRTRAKWQESSTEPLVHMEFVTGQKSLLSVKCFIKQISWQTL